MTKPGNASLLFPLPSSTQCPSCLVLSLLRVSGFLGVKIATYANEQTTLEARKGVGKAFIVTFRFGAVTGFPSCC
ncbi:Pyrophosphate-energized vacuolar membrane proton pump 1 [Bienertia sinuspersici]